MVNRRLIASYGVLVVVTIGAFTVAYGVGMSVFEGRPRSLLASLEIVLQTFTTTGYGQDAPWTSPQMKFLTVTMQVTAMLLVFGALPVVVVPALESIISDDPPDRVVGVEDHVVVCGARSRTPLLADELGRRGVDHAIAVEDRDRARELDEEYTVVHGDPAAEETLVNAALPEGRALVADAGDESNLSVAIAAAEVGPELPVYAVADDPEFTRYHRHAGATQVFSPRELLGSALATKVLTAVSIEGDIFGEVGTLSVAEFPITPGSDLNRQRITEANLESRSGANVVGAWASGEFLTPPFPDLTLDEHTDLLVVGTPTQVERLEQLTDTNTHRHRSGEVVVLGHGAVGSTVATELREAGRTTTVVDVDDQPGVDVVGDATEAAVLRQAGVQDATTVVVALDDDDKALVTTFVVADLTDDVETVVRANDADSVRKLYRAGADSVLSLAAVTARLVSAAITAEGEVVSYDTDVLIVRRSVDPLAGETIENLEIQERTGCTPVARIHRDGRTSRNLSPWDELSSGDHLVVAGVERDVDRFDEFLAGRASSGGRSTSDPSDEP
jgi:Trk K+ transport system NAD-binding subunit